MLLLTAQTAALTRHKASHPEELRWSDPRNGGTNELPEAALRLRDLETGDLVAPAGGYPRIVPYNPEAGEHVIGVQPASDLAPCRWYEVETTEALIDARLRPVEPATWRFQTGGCGIPAQPIRGTTTCDATGSFKFQTDVTASSDGTPGRARISLALTNCDGGQNGRQRRGSSLPLASDTAEINVSLPGSSCADLTAPSSRIRGYIRGRDAQGAIPAEPWRWRWREPLQSA